MPILPDSPCGLTIRSQAQTPGNRCKGQSAFAALAFAAALSVGLPAQAVYQPGAPATAPEQLSVQPRGRQEDAAVAMNALGESATAWFESIPGSAASIRVQRFDAAGLPTGLLLTANTTSIRGSSPRPSVAISRQGELVVSWTQFGPWAGDPPQALARRFDRDGQALGGEFRVSEQLYPETSSALVGMQPDGSYVLAFVAYPGGGAPAELRMRRFDRDGQPQGPEVLVAQSSGSSGIFAPKLALGPTGSALFVWSEARPGGSEEDIYARYLHPDARPPQSILRVNRSLSGRQTQADVGMRSDGSAVVLWQSTRSRAPTQTLAQLLNPNAGFIGSELVLANQEYYPKAASARPSLAVASVSGDFAAAWRRGDGHIYLRHFHADGRPLGPEVRTSESGRGHHYPDLAMDADGDLLLAWRADHSNTYSGESELWQRRFAGLRPIDVRLTFEADDSEAGTPGFFDTAELRALLLHPPMAEGVGVASGITVAITAQPWQMPREASGEGWLCLPGSELICSYLPALVPTEITTVTGQVDETPTPPLRLSYARSGTNEPLDLEARLRINQLDASALNDLVRLRLD